MLTDVQLIEAMLIKLREFDREISSRKRYINPSVKSDTLRLIRALEYDKKDCIRRENRAKQP